MNWFSGNIFAATITCRRDWLTEKIEGQCLHKNIYSSDKTKVVRFFRPVFFTKNTEKVMGKRTRDDGEEI